MTTTDFKPGDLLVWVDAITSEPLASTSFIFILKPVQIYQETAYLAVDLERNKLTTYSLRPWPGNRKLLYKLVRHRPGVQPENLGYWTFSANS